jgi:predicted ATPase/DNA-binding winged helix-turn-helix (wHTH) protein
MSAVHNDQPVVRFASFQLLPAKRQLLRNGVAVPLGGRAMDLLLHLTAHAGTVVSKNALLSAVWPDRIVEENNLTVHMAALRRALGDGVDGRPMIQTVTGRGYLFIADAASSAGPTERPQPAAPTTAPEPASALAPLPQPATRLIGREQAMSELRQFLGERRVVSIVGPGGVGKSTLALHLAADLKANFPDGIAFVDLSSIGDAARVAEAVAAAVLAGGVGANTVTARVVALLGERKALLVLDNCEHLVEPVAELVSAVIAACPGMVVLVTSREGLFVTGEQIYRLPPLPFPREPHRTDASTAQTYGAVRLFVERAEALGSAAVGGRGGVARGFVLDDQSAPAVASICARLDGIPLAIEMAVPRLKVLSPAQLAERLDERFRLLMAPGRGATPRHRTLRAMIDWSYDFLSTEERALLRCLSTFAGGADLAAIEALAGVTQADDVELLDRLTSLADKSLLTVDAAPDEEPRFRLLETIRQYAASKAEEAGQLAGKAGLAARHAVFFEQRFDAAARLWPTTTSRAWLALYAPDADNLRSALGWAFGPDGDASIGLRLVASTVPLWWELPETPVAEGQRWLAVAANHVGPDTPAAVRGWLRFGQSWRDFRFADRENVQGALDAAALFRQADEKFGLGAALWRAGSALLTQETIDQAEGHLVEAEQVLRGLPPSKWLALTLIRLGDLRFRRGHLEDALASYQEGFDLSRKLDFWIGQVNGGSNMAELLLTAGEADRALSQLLALRDELPPSRRTPLMGTLAAHLLLTGDWVAMRQAALETVNQGAAIGLAAATAWAAEAVALYAAAQGNLTAAAELAGYARLVHPSVATRAGSRKVVVELLDGLLSAGLSPDALKARLAIGASWTLGAAAERARQALGPEERQPAAD